MCLPNETSTLGCARLALVGVFTGVCVLLRKEYWLLIVCTVGLPKEGLHIDKQALNAVKNDFFNITEVNTI